MTMSTGAPEFLPTPTDSHGLAVRVITPRSGFEGFRRAIESLWKEFPRGRGLAWRFFLRDTRAEHRQSLLGYVWLIVPVLANVLTWVFLNSQGVIRVDSGAVPYPLFVLSGVILWTAFNGGVMAMLGVVNLARGVLAKVNFPHESLVFAAVLKSLLDASLAALLMIPALLLLGATWTASMALYPIALFASLLLGGALGLLIVPFAALYTDISRGVQLILRFGFFFTPVIYAIPAAGLARRFMLLNPATPVITSGRAWLTGSPEALPAEFALVTGVAVFLFFLALLLYKVSMPHIIERIGG